MAQAAGFVPAWKRLGLKLTHFPESESDQSGDPLSHVAGAQKSTAELTEKSGRRGSKDDIHHADIVTIEKGNGPRIAKRKPQDAPAEDHHHAFKKSRKSLSEDQEPSHAITAKEVTDQAPSTSDKPKGDSNYRQKKSRGARQDKPTPKQNKVNTQPTSSTREVQRPQPVHSPSPGNADFANDEATLLLSTETSFPTQSSTVTERPKKTSGDTSRDIANSTLETTPLRTDRRKSVTFTPDTKTADGNSASNLFRQWVLEQNPGFSATELSQFVEPPSVHPANDRPVSQSSTTKEEKEIKKSEKKNNKKQKEVRNVEAQLEEVAAEELAIPTPSSTSKTPKITSSEETPKSSTSIAPKGKKKDPSLYLSYLSQYHNDRDNWKFNKAKQNDVLDNALNIFRIPDEYLDALLEYTKGLKGASVVTRLTEKCQKTIAELDDEEKKQTATMDPREVAKQEALEERMIREKRRRELDGDLDNLKDHPYSDGFIRRLKRRRAEALLGALNLAIPIRPVQPAQPVQLVRKTPSKTIFADTEVDIVGPKKIVRKRKSRTEVESDSSDTSSSDDESTSDSSDSESESGSGSEDSDEGTKSTSGSTSGSDSSDSESGDQGRSSNSDGDNENDGNSSGDSDSD
ncbi:hypothetical protein K504DRAFT_389736 [Pleomassaria siparia CBS 279.74]|uniref:WKF domain-containing protein n=1 Tax=Pleomassaria siparia CBS 279.74 TaxID=1314801 RepID=A0A6G1JWD6_9PLEO|nr:hypothetical protein K504DRAFT_389736 [Pleomassaria siparia CBS 279.74]